MWAVYYETGRLQTHAYPDVKEAFRYWRTESFIRLYLYASGSVDEQQLFLRVSEAGNLAPFFTNFLNSTGGLKFQADKFKTVALALRVHKPEHLLYVTSSTRKAMVAREAGLRTLVLNRHNETTGEFNAEKTRGHVVVTTLADIEFVESIAPQKSS